MNMCETCKNEHSGKYGSGRFCSTKCARSFSTSKDRKAINSKIGKSLTGKPSFFLGKLKVLREERMCPKCKSTFTTRVKSNTRYCSRKCGGFNGGGLRDGAGRGKSGKYKGIRCDSTWELAWVIYQIDHNIEFQRNHQGFKYEYNGSTHTYYPDFMIDGVYYEIKGYESPQFMAKKLAFPYELIVIGKAEIVTFINYAKSKYGNNLILAYDEIGLLKRMMV